MRYLPSKRAWIAAAICGLAPLTWTHAAAAGDETKTCALAAEKGQRLRNEGKLRDAREQLVVCAREVCPSVIRKDCEPWLSELDARVPTVIISAKDGKGSDLVDVKVTLDGAPLTAKLDGKAIPMDPGAHALKYERAGSAAIDATVVIREGEKGRVIDIVFDPLPAVVAEPEKKAAPPPQKAGLPIPAIVVGAIGVVAIGSFVYFDLSAKSKIDDLRATCAPRCDPGEVDSVNTKIIIADVSLGAGVVALGVATWLFVSGMSSKPSQVQIGLMPLVHGGAGSFRASF